MQCAGVAVGDALKEKGESGELALRRGLIGLQILFQEMNHILKAEGVFRLGLGESLVGFEHDAGRGLFVERGGILVRCRQLGFERLVLKNQKLMCFFVEDPQSTYYESPAFAKISQLIAIEGKLRGLRLKQTPRSLIMIREGVKSLSLAEDILKAILEKLESESMAESEK